jgi:hypothetical protein
MHTLAKSGGNPTMLHASKLGGKPSASTVIKAKAQVFVKVHTPTF